MTPARPTWPADIWALEGDAARERKRLADHLASSRPAESVIAARNEGVSPARHDGEAA